MAHARQRAAGLGKSMGVWVGTLQQACTVIEICTISETLQGRLPASWAEPRGFLHWETVSWVELTFMAGSLPGKLGGTDPVGFCRAPAGKLGGNEQFTEVPGAMTLLLIASLEAYVHNFISTVNDTLLFGLQASCRRSLGGL